MQTKNQTEFDAHAESYDEDLRHALSVTGEGKDYFCKGRMQWLGEWLKRNGHPSKAVLDYGCGTGSATPYILEHLNAVNVLGLDVSEASLNIAASSFPDLPVHFQKVGEPGGEMFDVAFCNGVFHHIQPSERQQALAEIHEHLRSRGIFALFENNPWNPATRYVMSRCSFDRNAITLTPFECRRRMREAGFEILQTRYLFVFPSFLKAMRFIEPSLSAMPLGGQYVVVGKKGKA